MGFCVEMDHCTVRTVLFTDSASVKGEWDIINFVVKPSKGKGGGKRKARARAPSSLRPSTTKTPAY